MVQWEGRGAGGGSEVQEWSFEAEGVVKRYGDGPPANDGVTVRIEPG